MRFTNKNDVHTAALRVVLKLNSITLFSSLAGRELVADLLASRIA